MKVQVKVKYKCNFEGNTSVKVVVGPGDTVASVKGRVVAVEPNPFPTQDLMLNGEVLEDGQRLSDCAIKDGSSLDLVVHASEGDLVKQFTELLQARDLSCDELSLLYCYKFGSSVSQALKVVGSDATSISDFIKLQKEMVLENGRVSVRRAETSLKPFSVVSEIEAMLKASDGSLAVKELCDKFVKKFGVSLASIVGMKPVEFLGRETNFVVHNGAVSLKGSPTRCSKQAAKPALSTDGRAHDPEMPPGLLKTQHARIEEGNCIDNQPYVELHEKISSRAFHSRCSQVANNVIDTIMDIAFLNIECVVKGGAVGKGTATVGAADMEVVCFVQGLPQDGHEKWLPPLLRAAACILGEQVGNTSHGDNGGHVGLLTGTQVTEDSVRLHAKDCGSIDVRFSPIFGSYAAAVEVLREQSPTLRRFYTSSLVKERVQFVARQPGNVKVTIRLLKWWRDLQAWSSKLARPSDDILELVVIYGATKTKLLDQRMAIDNVMSLMSRFNDLKICWSNFYSKEDIWAPLLKQCPLIMDPVNPFMNVADPQSFDSSELIARAQTTHFFS
jgi:hypothetical protein